MRKFLKRILCYIIAFILCGSFFLRRDYNNYDIDKIIAKTDSSYSPAIPDNEPPAIIEIKENPAESADSRSYVKRKLRREVIIGAVGDVSLASNYTKPYDYSFDYYYDNFGAEYFFENVREIFEKFDVTIANLECALTDNEDEGIRLEKAYCYKGRKEYADILRLGGIDVVNLSNNHTFDYSQEGYHDTIDALEKAGIEYFGDDIILIKEVNDIKIGFIGSLGSANVYGARLQNLKASLDYLEEQGAVLKIAVFHWGNMSELFANDNQKYLARFVIDNGADLVLGHHPHVLQGLEIYKDKYIAYSLGNFIFDGNMVSDIEHRTSVIFQIKYIFEGREIISSEIKLIPALASSERWRNNFQPVLAEGEMYDEILNKIEERSKEKAADE